MNSAGRATETRAAAPGVADVRGIALGYEPPAGDNGDGRLWIPAGGSHRVVADRARTARLLAAILELKPERSARLVALGVEIGELRLAGRTALRARIAVLPAAGGLISHLNAWENIVLPLGFHHPERVRGSAAGVHTLLAGLGAEPRALLAKRPEVMTLYEKKLTGYVRILLEAPDLLLAVDLTGGLDAAERERAMGFAGVYHATCPGGTFVQFEDAPDA